MRLWHEQGLHHRCVISGSTAVYIMSSLLRDGTLCLRSFGMVRRVDWWLDTDVSKHPIGPIFKGQDGTDRLSRSRRAKRRLAFAFTAESKVSIRCCLSKSENATASFCGDGNGFRASQHDDMKTECNCAKEMHASLLEDTDGWQSCQLLRHVFGLSQFQFAQNENKATELLVFFTHKATVSLSMPNIPLQRLLHHQHCSVPTYHRDGAEENRSLPPFYWWLPATLLGPCKLKAIRSHETSLTPHSATRRHIPEGSPLQAKPLRKYEIWQICYF